MRFRARVLPLRTRSGIGVAAIEEGIVDVDLDPIERDDGGDRAAGPTFSKENSRSATTVPPVAGLDGSQRGHAADSSVRAAGE